jgi:hypothetical protein
MSEKLVRLASGAAQPEVELTVGQAQFGSYKLYLWDPDRQNAELLGNGSTEDQIQKRFIIPKPLSTLDRFLLSWEVKIAAFSDDPGQLYAATINITQSGDTVSGGRIVNTGALNGAVFLNDFVRLIVI